MNNNKTLKEYLLTEKMNIPYAGEYTIADGILFIVNLVIFPALELRCSRPVHAPVPGQGARHGLLRLVDG